MLCPGSKCPHYDTATKYERACYYEAQCWRGIWDAVFFTIGLILGGKR